MPAGAVYVGRPTTWGNPFTVREAIANGYADTVEEARRVCTLAFRDWLNGNTDWMGDASEQRRDEILAALPMLADRDLVCWCPVDQPCHGDVLLLISNQPAGGAA